MDVIDWWLGPLPDADLSRVRSGVALRILPDKAVHWLDAIDAEQPSSLKTLLPDFRTASTIVAVLAHTHL